MLRFVLVIASCLSLLSAVAQAPEWIDFNERQKLYPTRIHLVGYAQETGVKKDALQVSYEYIEQLARAELIESVQVLINSVSTAQTSDYDGEISDFFDNETVSSSSANLVGLKTERYYDKKKKTTHVLVHIRRDDLIAYYVSSLGKNVNDIEQLVSQANKAYQQQDFTKSFEGFYKTAGLFQQIDESQTYLLALGEKNTYKLQFDEVNALKSKVEDGLLLLKNDKSKTVDDIAYFIAYALGKETISTKDSVVTTPFTFEETGIDSKFALILQQKIISDLKGTSNYAVANEQRSDAKNRVQGTYWEKGDMLLLKTSLYQTEKKTNIKSFATSIAKAAIGKNTPYLSEDIVRIQQISSMEIKSGNSKMYGKVGFPLSKNLIAKVYVKNESGKLIPKSNVPVRFVDKENGVVYGTSWTDAQGVASYKVKRVKSGKHNQVIEGELDIDAYLEVGSENEFLKKVLRLNGLPFCSYQLTITESLVYFDVSEKNFGQNLAVPMIEPELKRYLSEAGYKFTLNKAEADLVVTINSDTRQGGDFNGLFFSYLDVNLSIRDNKSQKEMFKKSFNGYKGSGVNYQQAGGNSYRKGVKKICPEVFETLAKR